jgi:hypothetical protein
VTTLNLTYSDPWEVPAINKYMTMLGCALIGTRVVNFHLPTQRMIEKVGLYYLHDDGRKIVICTSGTHFGMESECMTLFKIIAISSKLSLLQHEAVGVEYFKRPLCSLSWRQSLAAEKWDGKAPYLDRYVSSGSLRWTLNMHERNFML